MLQQHETVQTPNLPEKPGQDEVLRINEMSNEQE